MQFCILLHRFTQKMPVLFSIYTLLSDFFHTFSMKSFEEANTYVNSIHNHYNPILRLEVMLLPMHFKVQYDQSTSIINVTLTHVRDTKSSLHIAHINTEHRMLELLYQRFWENMAFYNLQRKSWKSKYCINSLSETP